jgi:hypothetical protein
MSADDSEIAYRPPRTTETVLKFPLGKSVLKNLLAMVFEKLW